MKNLLSLLSKESIKVAHLKRVYATYGTSEGFAADAIRAMRELDANVAWRAIWLLKRLAADQRLSDAEVNRIAQSAEEMTDWAARLNLCQLLTTTGCPAESREVLYPYLVECFSNRRPMIRAWAISVLVPFQAEERYRKPVKAMLREAAADPAGSVQARLRRLKRASPRLDFEGFACCRRGHGQSVERGKKVNAPRS